MGLKFKTQTKCQSCRIKYLCLQCPGRALVENGDMESPVEFFCELAHKQADMKEEVLRNERLGLLSGIADPDSFENLIRSLGMSPEILFTFPDHHNYSPFEIRDIVSKSKARNITAIITKAFIKVLNPDGIGARPNNEVNRFTK